MWLEDYLSKWNKILFMVSHSQDFMNTVCTHMVHHTSKKKLVYYSGNYDQFVQTRMEKSEEQEKRFKSEQDQIKHMKDYVARFGQGNAKMARQAQSKEKILDKMLKSGLTDKVEVEKALDFKFPDCGKISPPVLQCNDLSFGALASPVFQTTSRRDPRLIFSTLSLCRLPWVRDSVRRGGLRHRPRQPRGLGGPQRRRQKVPTQFQTASKPPPASSHRPRHHCLPRAARC